MTDFRTVRDFLHTPVLLALMEAPVSSLFLILIFAISPVLGWSAVVAALVQTFVGWLNERSTVKPVPSVRRVKTVPRPFDPLAPPPMVVP